MADKKITALIDLGDSLADDLFHVVMTQEHYQQKNISRKCV